MALSKGGYVVVGETAIYGTGETQDKAWDDAQQWVNGAGGADDYEWTDGLECWPATKALLAEVAERGGAIAWRSVGSVACTIAEQEELED